MTKYLSRHPLHVSAVTVFERVRGYAILARRSRGPVLAEIEHAREEYLADPGYVVPIGRVVATIGAEICALIPQPASPVRRSHRGVESRADRLARWRNDALIAATALAEDMVLIHNNAADFEAIRGAIERDPLRFPGLGPLKLMRCESVL
jgi:hypothetical protein